MVVTHKTSYLYSNDYINSDGHGIYISLCLKMLFHFNKHQMFVAHIVNFWVHSIPVLYSVLFN